MTSAPLLLGIDVGTTRTKAGLVGPDGKELAVASAPTVWRGAATGAETTGTDLMASVRRAATAVLRDGPGGDVVGVGVTSISESMVLVGGDEGTIGPVVAWHDERARGDSGAMNADFGADVIGRRTGLGTDQIPSAPTLRWIARRVPGAARCRRALSVAEWIVASLGGDTAAEASLASRTGGLSLAAREWWPEMIAWTGLPLGAFPEIRTAGERWGRVRHSGPGLQRLDGAWLTVAGHDHPCASVGLGVTGPHQVADSCGTAEALVRPVAAQATRDPTVGLAHGISTGWHVLPDAYLLLGGRPLGIGLLRVLQTLGAQSEGAMTALDAAGLALDDDAGRPALDDDVERSAATEWRAALAANVQSALDLLRSLEQIGGPVSEVRLSGGWARNPLLRHLKAAAMQPAIRPLYPLVAEAGVRGAALLAGRAAGLFATAADFPDPPVAPDHAPCPAA